MGPWEPLAARVHCQLTACINYENVRKQADTSPDGVLAALGGTLRIASTSSLGQVYKNGDRSWPQILKLAQGCTLLKSTKHIAAVDYAWIHASMLWPPLMARSVESLLQHNLFW
eukprot:1157306-Pelagomonas_calceolata.AAC.8